MLQVFCMFLYKMINERFRTNIEIKYHNVIIGFNPENCKNHAAINTIIMAVKERICYKDRLKTHDPATIKSIFFFKLLHNHCRSFYLFGFLVIY